MDAGRRLGREAALGLARSVSRVVVMKFGKVVEFEMRGHPPAEETLLAHLLGRTGNLRAPAVKVGDTLLVGFEKATYAAHFAASRD